MMTRNHLLAALLATIVSGCTGMSQREQSTLSGAAIGAGGGAVLSGASGGRPAVGAVLGGAAGGLTGYILGDRDTRKRKRR